VQTEERRWQHRRISRRAPPLRGVVVTCGDDVVARLRGDYPAWDIVRAGGQWLATRERVLFEVEMSCGLRHVLTADTAGRLRAALAAQHNLETGVSRELA
jgi:hypothetical protein